MPGWGADEVSGKRAMASAAATVTASAATLSTALDGPPPWSYRCSLTGDGDGAARAIDIGAGGVTVATAGGEPERLVVRHLDGRPSTGVGIRLIDTGAAPMTLRIWPGPVGSTTPASAGGAAGTWSGACTRRPDG